MPDVAGAYVTISPDIAGFREQLDAELGESMAGVRENITVGLDDAEAKAGLAELAAEVKAVGSENISVGTSGSGFADVTAGIRATSAAMRDLESENSNVLSSQSALRDASKAVADGMKAAGEADRLFTAGMADMDNQGRGLGATLRDLISNHIGLSEAMQRVVGNGGSMTQTLEALGGSSGGASGGLKDLASSASDGGAGLGALGQAAIALAPALIPVAAAATGAMLGLTGAITAAGAGFGAFALAASGHLKEVSKDIKFTVDAWGNSLQGSVAPVLAQIPGLVSTALNDMRPLVEGASVGLSSVISSLEGQLQSPAFRGFFDWLGGQAPAAMSALTTAVENFGAGFAGMLEASTPLIGMMERGMVSLSASFEAFATSQRFREFVQYAQRELPIVGDVLRNLGGIIEETTIRFAPLGDGLLKAVDGLSKLGKGAVDASRAMAPLFDVAGKAMGVVGDVFGAIGSVFELGTPHISAAAVAVHQTSEAAQQAAADLQRYATAASDAGESVSQLTGQLDKVGQATSQSFSQFGNIIGNLPQVFGSTGDAISTFYSQTTQTAQTFLSNYQTAIKQGFDPTLLSQLMQAGPAQAGPILQAMVSDTSGSLVSQVNAGVAALNQLTQQAVQMARLTQIAIHAPNAQIANDLPDAIRASQAAAVQGINATIQGVAQALGMGIPQVEQLNQEYGLGLKNAIDAAQGGTLSSAQAQVNAYLTSMANGQAASDNASNNVTKALPDAAVAHTPASAQFGAAQALSYVNSVANAYGPAVGAGTSVAGGVVSGFGSKASADAQAGIDAAVAYYGNIDSPGARGAAQQAAANVAAAAGQGFQGAVAAAQAAGANARQAFLDALGSLNIPPVSVPVAFDPAAGGFAGYHPPTATGGVFNTPQVRLFAEAGPEAVVPLSNPTRANEVMAQAGLAPSAAGPITYSPTVQVIVPAGSNYEQAQYIASAVQSALEAHDSSLVGQIVALTGGTP